MAQLLGQGTIRKMQVTLESPVQYVLPIGKGTVQMNDLLGQHLMLRYVGRIECVGCGRTTRKSFNQGYCFPCFRRLAECDLCILRPETLSFPSRHLPGPDLGTESLHATPCGVYRPLFRSQGRDHAPVANPYTLD